MAEIWAALTVDQWLKVISLVGTFAAWVLTNRRRPRLEAFFTHGSAHLLPGTNTLIHTHSLVVRNAGNYPATNVRITHGFVPPGTDMQVYPDRPKTFTSFSGTGTELLLERLRPKEQITISYLYPGPTLFNQFDTRVRFDDGFANFFPMEQVRVAPAWLKVVVLFLISMGFALTLYAIMKGFLFYFGVL